VTACEACLDSASDVVIGGVVLSCWIVTVLPVAVLWLVNGEPVANIVIVALNDVGGVVEVVVNDLTVGPCTVLIEQRQGSILQYETHEFTLL